MVTGSLMDLKLVSYHAHIGIHLSFISRMSLSLFFLGIRFFS